MYIYTYGWRGGCWCTFFKKVSFFHTKVPFVANMERYPKFLEYALFMSYFGRFFG